MKFWWAFQGQTDDNEKEHQFLWAPQKNEDGKTFFFWDNLKLINAGDKIFCFRRKFLNSIAIAQNPAKLRQKPKSFEDDRIGWRLEVSYSNLSMPIAQEKIVEACGNHLIQHQSPINRHGNGNHGYVYSLSDACGYIIESFIDNLSDFTNQGLENFISSESKEVTSTTRQSIILARIGQGKFRQELMNKWGNKCCITGVNTPELIRASHIKSWLSSSNYERLDSENGLLLAVHLDAAFDKGLITFDKKGKIIISPHLNDTELARLGISTLMQLSRSPSAPMKTYLEWHNANTFRAGYR